MSYKPLEKKKRKKSKLDYPILEWSITCEELEEKNKNLQEEVENLKWLLKKFEVIKKLYRRCPGDVRRYTEKEHKIIDLIIGSKFNINPFYAMHMLKTEFRVYKLMVCKNNHCYSYDVCNYAHSLEEREFMKKIKSMYNKNIPNG